MDPGLLYESPFTELTAQGPESLFTDTDSLVAVIDSVRATAHPEGAVA